MKNENAQIEQLEFENEYDFNFDYLERKLEDDLSFSISDLDLLEEDQKKIGNPDSLGEIIHNTVMDQINNQIAGLGAEEFIEKNNKLEFDPRSSAHIQTTENFAKGKIAHHNKEINYHKRYDNWQNKFQKNEEGEIRTRNDKTGKTKAIIVNEARGIFDRDRATGSKEKGTDMDHTVSAAEIIRDPEANTHLTEQKQVEFANGKENLNEMNSSHNQSKSDLKTDEWLDNPNSKGQKPREIFDGLDEKKEKEYRAKDKEARKKYIEDKTKGKQESIITGKKSQKEEIGKMASSAGKAVGAQFIMKLLKDLLTEIIRNLISWFKSKVKKIDTFLHAMKTAIKSFVQRLKNEIGKHIKDAISIGVKVILGAIFKPIGRIIQKFGTMIKQGYNSIKNAIDYLRNPENKNASLSVKVAQIGKIVVTGLTAAGAILGGQIIESGLVVIPVVGQILAFEIPLIGSLASLIGLFMSAMVAGILGAIVLKLIDKFIAKRLQRELVIQQIDKSNEILKTQSELINVVEHKLDNTKNKVKSSIINRHIEANKILGDSLSNIIANDSNGAESNNEDDFNDIFKNLNNL